MYHGIIAGSGDVPPGREPGADRYDVPLQTFSRQMQWLKDSGCSVSLAGPDTPSAPVVITFDDGEMNNFTRALNVLRGLGFPAYFFVTVNRVGAQGYMGWGELSELARAGMAVGSHGLTHRILTGLPDAELKSELEESRCVLEGRLGIAVKDFSVPRGFYDEKVVEAAMAAGYQKIFVSESAPHHPRCVGRVAVQSSWSQKRFEMAVEGKVPAGEKVFNICKETCKAVLGGAGYDRLRSALLKGPSR